MDIVVIAALIVLVIGLILALLGAVGNVDPWDGPEIL